MVYFFTCAEIASRSHYLLICEHLEPLFSLSLGEFQIVDKSGRETESFFVSFALLFNLSFSWIVTHVDQETTLTSVLLSLFLVVALPKFLQIKM